VHTSQCPFEAIVRDRTLGWREFDGVSLEFFLGPGSREKSPWVLSPLYIDGERTLELCLSKNHLTKAHTLLRTLHNGHRNVLSRTFSQQGAHSVICFRHLRVQPLIG
jgi:hypothetical protein